MSIFGDEWLTTTIALNGQTSTEINLGRDYEYMNIYVPTIDSANLTFTVSMTAGGTFAQLGASAVTVVAGTGGFFTTIELGGYQFVKIVASAAQTTLARTFYVRGYRG